jgi:hypothetical protein
MGALQVTPLGDSLALGRYERRCQVWRRCSKIDIRR